MTATIQTLVLLVAVLVVVAIVARRLNVAPPILLVVAGLVLALIPGLPRIELAPELVLLGILPPLIYSAGVAMSWREFRFNLRPITLLAIGCVVFTTCAVAAVAQWLLGMPLAVGFVLGAIVSPPDAVAPLAMVRRLGIPRRLVVVLEGEGLANDATALILYRFAVAAVGSGVFSLTQAAGDRELERTAAHSGRYAAARNLLLGSAHLFARRTGLPRDRPADSNGIRSAGSDLVARPVARRAADRRDRHRCSVCLGLSGDLFAAPAEPQACAPRSGSALAAGLLSCVRRYTRRRLAGGGAGHSVDQAGRRAVSLPRSHSLRDFRSYRRHADRPGINVAGYCALAWVGEPRGRGAAARAGS